jgi:molybdenum cofactor cytidylyltransferase
VQAGAEHGQVVGILLAAGKGARFDPSGAEDKLMQEMPGGEAVAVVAARTLVSALPRVLAVVRPGADALAAALRDTGCQVNECPTADQGMGASLVCALAQMRDSAGWVIALADMPYVRASTILAVADALRHDADIAQPVHQGQRGNPVGFGRSHLPQLLALGGDQGARSLLKTHPVVDVAVDDAGILQDIDTRKDLA